MSIDAIPRCDAPTSEVRGAELSHSLDDTAVGTLKHLWAENFGMLFHGQTLSDPNLNRFSLEFSAGYRAPIGVAMLNGDIPPKKNHRLQRQGAWRTNRLPRYWRANLASRYVVRSGTIHRE